MKLINFSAVPGNRNLYHLLQTTETLERNIKMFEAIKNHKKTPQNVAAKYAELIEKERASLMRLSSSNATYRITGACKQIQEGDVLTETNFPRHKETGIREGCLIVRSVLKRDHTGVFPKDSDRTSAFFDALCDVYPITVDEANAIESI